MLAASLESGMSYQLISGVQKIKLAGAEKRSITRWGRVYARQAALEHNPPFFLKISPVIEMAISLIGIMVIYYTAIRNNISISQFYAFASAYGIVSVTFAELTDIAIVFSQIRPVMEMVRPIMETEPEISANKRVVDKLSGRIELSNVTFRYTEDMPYVLDNLSLKIQAGQYVAIVGKTGCGKSTLMRIILGFETPIKGAVYFDGQDLKSLDLKSLRQKIGTVMQGGKLFIGNIYSNIVISAPHLTVDDAWEAAEMAGIADDIRDMPMGMHTLISEGSGGISGGQRQRLMIARAIVSKPKILLFDEATSALDNISQKKVSDSLSQLKCTRIVIAHRLSTIQECDRIIVLDQGQIVEDGTYEELLEKNGVFTELVERQRIEEDLQ
jgi:ABC-type bacteriocin/lantibiotic exporter with double-glycine peptidase domain